MQSMSWVLPLFPLFSTTSEEPVSGTELGHRTGDDSNNSSANTTINEPQRVIEVQVTGSLL